MISPTSAHWLGALCAACTCLQAAHAGDFYTDRQAFVDATAAQVVTDPYPVASPGTTFTSGAIEFFALGGSSFNFDEWTTQFPGNDLALNGNEELSLLVATDVLSMGIDFRDAPPGEGGGGTTQSTFTVQIYDGGVLVESTTFLTPDSPEETFIGYHSNEPFDRMTITESTAANENEFFGAVYTGTLVAPPGSSVGHLCVGVDCVNTEDFGNDAVRLKENNLRIRLHDTSVAPVLGASWNIEANSSTNGGRSYLGIGLKSLEQDTLALSDGTAPAYDCSVPQPSPFPVPAETIPAGQPIITPVLISCTMFPTSCTYECQTVPDYTTRSLLQLRNANNGAAIGYESTVENEAISVGRADLARQIKHVAAGLAHTDLLTVQSLNAYDALAAPKARAAGLGDALDGLATELDAIEIQLTLLESDDDNDGLNFYRETFLHGTDPNLADTDGDGVADGDEIAAGLDPTNNCDAGILDLCSGSALRIIRRMPQ